MPNVLYFTTMVLGIKKNTKILRNELIQSKMLHNITEKARAVFTLAIKAVHHEFMIIIQTSFYKSAFNYQSQ